MKINKNQQKSKDENVFFTLKRRKMPEKGCFSVISLPEPLSQAGKSAHAPVVADGGRERPRC
jgi:hypothetical protein